MATRSKGYTPPKGRATASRDVVDGRSSRIPPMLEWIALVILVVGLVVAAWVFTSSGDGAGPHNGSPAAAVGDVPGAPTAG